MAMFRFSKGREAGPGFEPDLHFTGPAGDRGEVAFVQRLLDKYGDGIAAYATQDTPGVRCLPGTFSVELQFADRAKMRECRAEYRAGPKAKAKG